MNGKNKHGKDTKSSKIGVFLRQVPETPRQFDYKCKTARTIYNQGSSSQNRSKYLLIHMIASWDEIRVILS